MIKVYGIPNCDTVKKVLTWLKVNKIDFEFHDYKKEGAPTQKLNEWVTQRNWDELLNKKSTTWRELDIKTQEKLKDAKSAVKLMNEHTSLIKRPVIEKENEIIAVGFKEEEYKKIFSKK